jgi:hypothetical protein
MLADTLVVWTTEFGELPSQKLNAKGREPSQGLQLVAGRWRYQGRDCHGASDDYGIEWSRTWCVAVSCHDPVLTGSGPQASTFRHAGRDFRLTDVPGNVVEAILASASREHCRAR